MLRVIAAVAALAVGATIVHADAVASIGARKDALKAMGAAAKTPGGMIKGEVAFDLAQVKAALKVYQEQAGKLKDLFPDESKTGDTNALPVAFEKRADVQARFAKLADDAKAAEAVITDEATFKANWGKVMGNCGGCHKEYKKP